MPNGLVTSLPRVFDVDFVPKGLQVPAYDSILLCRILKCQAHHQGQPRGNPPNHQTSRLRPQQSALRQEATNRMKKGQEDLSQCV